MAASASIESWNCLSGPAFRMRSNTAQLTIDWLHCTRQWFGPPPGNSDQGVTGTYFETAFISIRHGHLTS